MRVYPCEAGHEKYKKAIVNDLSLEEMLYSRFHIVFDKKVGQQRFFLCVLRSILFDVNSKVYVNIIFIEKEERLFVSRQFT